MALDAKNYSPALMQGADISTTGAGSFGSVTTSGAVAATGAVTSSAAVTSSSASAGVGYATGAGGTVTQATNKSTGVTLNAVTGGYYDEQRFVGRRDDCFVYSNELCCRCY